MVAACRSIADELICVAVPFATLATLLVLWRRGLGRMAGAAWERNAWLRKLTGWGCGGMFCGLFLLGAIGSLFKGDPTLAAGVLAYVSGPLLFAALDRWWPNWMISVVGYDGSHERASLMALLWFVLYWPWKWLLGLLIR